jgi:hypothetical protein
MKTRIKPKHLHLTSLTITAVSLAISANQPVTGAPSFGAESKTVVAKRTKPIGIAPVSSPEAGVQLLMRILQSIGNEPQIALQKNQSQRLDEAPSNQMFMAQNSLDPALVIRPQANQQSMRAKKSANKSDQIIAMMPASRRQGYTLNEAGSKLSSAELAANKPMGSASNGLAGAPAAESSRSELPQANLGKSMTNWGDLSNKINRMYTATKFVEEITGNKKGEIDQQAADELASAAADTESKVIRTGNFARGTTISALPKIVDYNGRNAMGQASAVPSQGLIADRRMAPAEADSKRLDKDNAYAGGDRGATYAKLENPGAYRSVKEYSDSFDSDAPAPKDKAKARSPLGQNGIHVAYLPPQLVSGIPGLRLGVPEDQVDAYLRGKGNITRQTLNGWKVWSLKNEKGNKTLLQIYLRNGTVEAFRVFDQAFVPEGLGVALNDTLHAMKKKFGEAQFKLDEPSATSATSANSAQSGVTSGIKNYVYPVNQISFQLARNTSKDPVTVKSLLLFQFI